MILELQARNYIDKFKSMSFKVELTCAFNNITNPAIICLALNFKGYGIYTCKLGNHD